MLRIKSGLRLISEHKLLFLVVLFTFFSAPLRVYGPTSITLEVIIVGLLLFRYRVKVKNNLISSNSYLFLAFLFLYLLATYLFAYTDDGSGFFNENYRFLVFLLLTCVLATTKIDLVVLAKFCLWCCRFHIFFTLFELIFLSVISPGNFYGVPIVGPAMPDIEEASGYLQENDNLISFGYRPFGLMLQPQKTGFVFVLGVLLDYLLAKLENRKPSLLWNILFVVISIFQGAKTAFLILFAIEAAIFLNFYPGKKLNKSSVAFYVLCLIAIIYITVKNVVLTNIGNDTNELVFKEVLSFVKLPIGNIILGIGVPTVRQINAMGCAAETYFMRIIYNFGLPLTLAILYFMAKCFLGNNRKVNYILLLAFVGMIYHYCVINVYFIDLAFATCICLTLLEKQKC